MNWLKKYRILHSFYPAFIFILLSGSGLNAQTSQGFSSHDSIWVKDTIAPDPLMAADTFYVSQSDQFTDQEGFRHISQQQRRNESPQKSEIG